MVVGKHGKDFLADEESGFAVREFLKFKKAFLKHGVTEFTERHGEKLLTM
jgi:hypothetical protein